VKCLSIDIENLYPFSGGRLCEQRAPCLDASSVVLTIDNKCHVAGSMTFGYCNPGRSCVTAWQMSVSLWRSADGSRLTGTQVLTCPKCKSVQDPATTWVSPFEMIAGQ
jgi:hypothetical protein